MRGIRVGVSIHRRSIRRRGLRDRRGTRARRRDNVRRRRPRIRCRTRCKLILVLLAAAVVVVVVCRLRAAAADPRLPRRRHRASARTRWRGCRTDADTRYLGRVRHRVPDVLDRPRVQPAAAAGDAARGVRPRPRAGRDHDGRRRCSSLAARSATTGRRARAGRRARDELDGDRLEDARRAHRSSARRTAAT